MEDSAMDEEASFDFEGTSTSLLPGNAAIMRHMGSSRFTQSDSASAASLDPKMELGAKLDTPSSESTNSLPSDGPPEKSRFTDKLHTNYIPTQPEICEIKSYVSMISAEVSLYGTRIEALEAQLAELNSRRKALKDVADAHDALISPLRRLPPEILQLIFVWCLPQSRNAVMHASEAPVLLGRVCGEWRRISLATPELWASLHIVPPNVNYANSVSSTARFERKRDLISMWLDRAGACPLSISLVWFANDSEEEINLCGILLQVLVPMCARWKVLDFQVPLKMFRPFIGLTVDDVPLLEGISLMDNRTPLDTEASDRWPASLTFAESAAKLRNFTLTFFSGGIRLPTIPWRQLTVLYLESNIAFFFRDAQEMLDTLSGCVSLQSCTLKFPLSHTAALPTYEPVNSVITLPQLHTLCVDGDQHLQNTFHMSNTLSNLCLPRLRKLEILGRSGRPDAGSPMPEPLVAIKTLLQRSKCPLERLNVESMTLLPDEFIACLRLVPSLVDLVVHNWSVRVMPGSPSGEDGAEDVGEIPENQILKALTVISPGSVEGANAQNKTVNDEVATQVIEEGHLQQSSVLQQASTEPAETIASNGSQPIQPTQPDSAIKSFWTEDRSEAKKFMDVSEECHLNAIHSVGPFSFNRPVAPGKTTSTTSDITPNDNPTSSDFSYHHEGTPICPNLQRFDFTLSDASQILLCDFVASRWSNLPPGIARLKVIKCNFTAIEDPQVKERLQQFRTEGLDAYATYQAPMNDDMNPSPWTGLEGPGGP